MLFYKAVDRRLLSVIWEYRDKAPSTALEPERFLEKVSKRLPQERIGISEVDGKRPSKQRLSSFGRFQAVQCVWTAMCKVRKGQIRLDWQARGQIMRSLKHHCKEVRNSS